MYVPTWALCLMSAIGGALITLLILIAIVVINAHKGEG